VRENRTHGSEGGEANSLPYPYRLDAAVISVKKTWVPTDQSPWAEGPRVMCGWPPARKEFSACLQLKVTCGHVSGLLARPQAAGPDGFRGSRPDQAREVALPHGP